MIILKLFPIIDYEWDICAFIAVQGNDMFHFKFSSNRRINNEKFTEVQGLREPVSEADSWDKSYRE